MGRCWQNEEKVDVGWGEKALVGQIRELWESKRWKTRRFQQMTKQKQSGETERWETRRTKAKKGGTQPKRGYENGKK